MKKFIILAALVLFSGAGLYAQTGTGTAAPAPGMPRPQNREEEIYRVVEVAPKAPYNLSDYLAQNIKYPAKAREAGIQGKVYISFVVEKDGSISKVEPVRYRTVDSSLTQEAVKVTVNMPKWIPATQNGVPVRCYFTMPVTFKLPGDAGIKNTDTMVYRYVAVAPKAAYNFIQYLGEHTKYPEPAKSERIEARIYVTFIVEKDGHISNATVTKGKEAGNGLPQEAIRVIASMPAWEPGRNEKGEPVRCYFTAPINFKVQ